MEYKICSQCIMDTTVQDIKFDEEGVCNYCKLHDELERRYPLDDKTQQTLENIVDEIKKVGEGKKYDSILGVSGGTDSTYCLYVAKKLGLRPLAVHFDNGWNSEIAVRNIQNTTSKLDVDLQTYVVDWDEFKDLQIAFLKASTPDTEIVTDIAIKSTLYRVAAEEGIRYIINGVSFRTEGKVPPLWSHGDGRYIESVYKEFGPNHKLKSFPNFMMKDLIYYGFIKKIKFIRLLYYVDYNKEDVVKLLKKELDWESYGHKHYESVFTRFFQSYILPKKFNIDKRKVHYSALVRSGQIIRKDALAKMKDPPIDEEHAREDKEYVMKKLELSEKQWDEIMSLPKKTFLDYPTYYPTIKKLKTPLKLFYRFLSPSVPPILYHMDSQ